MRAILDAILSFIGATSLTDLEFAGIGLDDTSDDLANYEALLGVLDSRELVSGMQKRLQYYYVAKGVDVPVADLGKSNILIGAPLCD